MIFDSLGNITKYRSLFPDFEYLLSLIECTGADCSIGSHNTASARIRYSVSSFKTTTDEKLFEVHRRETDIHIVFCGTECIETASIEDSSLAVAYNAEKDSSKFQTDSNSRIVLKPGYFAVFFPGEPHKPGLAYLTATDVKKIVFKVK